MKKLILMALLFIGEATFAAPPSSPDPQDTPPNGNSSAAQQKTTINFTDFLYEDWTATYEFGTTALFDSDSSTGITDLCGEVNPWYFGRAYNNHKGWDRNIPNDHGKYVVFAAGPGLVTNVINYCHEGDTGCGNYTGNRVIIDHGNGIVTKYFHGDHGNMLVKEGQWVDRHHALFIGDNTGYSSGAHSHFQIEVNGTAVDALASNDFAWKVAPKLNLNACGENKDPVHNLADPYTLFEYSRDKLAEIDAQAKKASGSIVKEEAKWMLNSGGSKKEDIIIRTYSPTSNAPLAVFDLLGNAPTAIHLPEPVVKFWQSKGGPEGALGKPLTPLYWVNGDWMHMDCEKGILSYGPLGESVSMEITTLTPGFYEDGNFRGGKSYAIITSYLKQEGSKNLQTATPVKIWNDYEVQKFSTNEGTGAVMLMPSLDNFVAYWIPPKFWDIYTSKGVDFFGAPTGDVYYDQTLSANRQDYEKGKSILNGTLIVETGNDCIDKSTPLANSPCACNGQEKEEVCGNCGQQQWKCVNDKWTKIGICLKEGVCSPGSVEKNQCQCGGKNQIVCLDNCEWGKWTLCAKYPTFEECDNIDNDCDGQTDEDDICCTPKTEVCDGKDNNCNGQVDENLGKTQCGVGWCDHIQYNCIKGKWYDCDPFLDAQPEVCDDEDNDCDGKTDEGLCCVSGPEICDAKDNNCNGQIDEDKVCCELEKEICNQKDDNCNGQIDEGLNCCVPQTEVCDAKDNDCDGQVDEGVKNACNGCSKLSGQPGTSCGTNGVYACEGANAVICKETIVPNDPPKDPPPSNPPPSDPPPSNPPPSNPPPTQTNACGGTSTLPATPATACGNKCGTWKCQDANTLMCANEGECTPGETKNQLCSAGGYCGLGLQYHTCNNACQWNDWGNCSTSKAYGYDFTKQCGDVICLTIESCSPGSCTVKISKADDGNFSNNAMEWELIDSDTGKLLAFPPGSGCASYYTGQSSFLITFNPDKFALQNFSLQFNVWSGGATPCSTFYSSGKSSLQKCN